VASQRSLVLFFDTPSVFGTMAAQHPPAAALNTKLSDMLWQAMDSVQKRFGNLDGLLMLQQIDSCYLVAVKLAYSP
jgi:hypothetical protein